MKPEIAEKISPEIALEMMNDIIDIHNCLKNDYANEAFFKMGVLTEQLAQRIRTDDKIQTKKI